MPTGYTADVATGKVDNFNDFAWLCARAFGACIELRDDAPAPERPGPFKASRFHAERLLEARAHHSALLSMGRDAMEKARDAAQAQVAADRALIQREQAEQLSRYEAMLRSAEAWTPPTPDHAGLKKFMAEQLKESIKFDCRSMDEYYTDLPPAPEWHRAEIEKAVRDIAYHAKHQAEDDARNDQRNAWVEALAKSLTPTPTGAPARKGE